MWTKPYRTYLKDNSQKKVTKLFLWLVTIHISSSFLWLVTSFISDHHVLHSKVLVMNLTIYIGAMKRILHHRINRWVLRIIDDVSCNGDVGVCVCSILKPKQINSGRQQPWSIIPSYEHYVLDRWFKRRLLLDHKLKILTLIVLLQKRRKEKKRKEKKRLWCMAFRIYDIIMVWCGVEKECCVSIWPVISAWYLYCIPLMRWYLYCCIKIL
jgi:hypothetical protein